MEPADQGEAGVDRAAVEQRRGNIRSEQTAAGRSRTAIDFAEQASGQASVRGAADFEAVAGRGIDRHMRAARDSARGFEEDAGVFLGRAEVGKQPARRSQFGARRIAEAVERRHAEPRLQCALARQAVESALAGAGRDPADGSIGDGFGGRQTGEFGGDLAGSAGDQLKPAGRDVGGGNAPIIPRLADRGEPVGGASAEQGILGQCSGRDQADDRAVDQRLGPARLARRGRAFDLFGNRDPVPGADQPGEIALGGMDRHTAHRNGFAIGGAAPGQRNVERLGGGARVVEEEFEEIAHAVE